MGIASSVIPAGVPATVAGKMASAKLRGARRSVSKLPRTLTLIASLLVLGAFVFPLWTVRLTAPQYPEGLGMQIRVNDVRGATETDLNNINNLNHYIGMKRIEPDAIPELRIMPWVVMVLAATGIGVALLGKRKPLYLWTLMFVGVAIAGLADFWKWEYDYGHNLDPRAILKIPGMTYQPPIIGSKQLLNFRAVSLPGIGGSMLIGALLLGLIAVTLTWRDRSSRPLR